jgi:hypothetical protein
MGANLFMLFGPLEGWRHIKVTDRHTAVDYAHVLKDLADIHFPQAKTIVLVRDNLNVHSKASLYDAFPAAEARQLVERSSLPNASTAAFPTKKPWPTKLLPGKMTAMPSTTSQTGASSIVRSQ